MLEPRKARCSTTRNTVLCEIPAFVSAEENRRAHECGAKGGLVAFSVESKSSFAQEPSIAFAFASQWPISAKITGHHQTCLNLMFQRKCFKNQTVGR